MAENRKTKAELAELLASAKERAGDGLWRHKATGAEYFVRDHGLDESTCTPVVVYRERNPLAPLVWVRPVAEFLERFERVEG